MTGMKVCFVMVVRGVSTSSDLQTTGLRSQRVLLTAMQIGFVSSVGHILTTKPKMVCMHTCRDMCAANVMIVTETLWWSESDIARKVVSLEE